MASLLHWMFIIYLAALVAAILLGWLLSEVLEALHDRVEWLPGSPAPAARWQGVLRVWLVPLVLLIILDWSTNAPSAYQIAGLLLLAAGLYFSSSKAVAERQARRYHRMRRAHCGMCGAALTDPHFGKCGTCGWELRLAPSQ